MCRQSQFTIPMLQELNRRYQCDIPMQDLARMYGVSFRTIQLNIWKPRKIGHEEGWYEKPKIKTKKERIIEMLSAGMTYRKIKEAMECGNTTISNYKKYI